ncbi:hypothetical protein [Sphingobacterium shayense]|uniref:hypothetical protein n=1 Tax=Sphingobacterium shayense TaxID=626343 RepID=UPI001FE6911C|nr:hypothetical protein [Sphingobacterium shayense]
MPIGNFNIRAAYRNKIPQVGMRTCAQYFSGQHAVNGGVSGGKVDSAVESGYAGNGMHAGPERRGDFYHW